MKRAIFLLIEMEVNRVETAHLKVVLKGQQGLILIVRYISVCHVSKNSTLNNWSKRICHIKVESILSKFAEKINRKLRNKNIRKYKFKKYKKIIKRKIQKKTFQNC